MKRTCKEKLNKYIGTSRSAEKWSSAYRNNFACVYKTPPDAQNIEA
jgi:hypothetical protein